MLQVVPAANDSGSATAPPLSAVGYILGFHGLHSELSRSADLPPHPKPIDLVRLLRGAGLKARAVRVPERRLSQTPFPALAVRRDGGVALVGGAGRDTVLVMDHDTGRPGVVALDGFLGDWSGVMILAARKSDDDGIGRRFDMRWFASAVRRYRGILGEVLVASFFLQVFALATPFAFQILVDKVLVNRGMSTLDVVAAALILVAGFEAILGGLRNFVFTHTTNRIDVELGARLFRHLLSLPLAYFQARRVGDSVARVRELENIRQFLTGSALTLVMDLLFTTVFLAVMATYSLPLTGLVLASLPLYAAISAIATPLFRVRLEERFRRGTEN